MKIPVDWLKNYIKTDKTSKQLAESFTSLGLMLDKPVMKYSSEKFDTDVLDLEHRMDRSDWLSITGCARDLAAFETTDFIAPDFYDKPLRNIAKEDEIKIAVECPDIVNRFNTLVFKNIKVKPSPDWLKNSLESYGIPSINNIVDITNFVMVELGQPMHAQDIKKLEKPEIVIRRAKKGEKLTTLLGETLVLDPEAFVLTQNGKPTVLGGIVGGNTTGVDATTTDIVLDAGNYDQVNVRKTSRRVKIQNETVLRYDKFLHPKLTEIALKRATKLILELAGGEVYFNDDYYPNEMPLKSIKLTLDRVAQISGIQLETTFIESTLKKLEYKILNKTKDGYDLEIPYFRTDVEVEDDVVSDLLRIYGYPKLGSMDLTGVIPVDITLPITNFEQYLINIFVNAGFHEHITDPLVTFTGEKAQVKLENSQSSLKNGLRTTMREGLAQVAAQYEKNRLLSAKLFEIGNVFAIVGDKNKYESYKETRIVETHIEIFDLDPADNSYSVRYMLDAVLKQLGIYKYELNKVGKIAVISYDNVILGELTHNGFTLNVENLHNKYKKYVNVTTELLNNSVDDISLELAHDVEAGEILDKIYQLDERVSKVDVIPQPSTKAGFKKLLFRITHTSKDFDKIRQELLYFKA